jgi:sulfoxide reductase heme-binding subunit YedZ
MNQHILGNIPAGRPQRNLEWFARHRFGTIRLASFLAGLAPAAWLAAEWMTGSLGVNPLNRLLHFTGSSALVMLLVTLSVTPARRLSIRVSQMCRVRFGKRVSDWNWLIRLRRQLGLFAFFYAVLHLGMYVLLDAGPDILAISTDAIERPFILLGFASFLLLVPLAATSNAFAIRRLGRNWRKLHALSYLIAILVIAHYWLQMKVGNQAYLPYALALVLLYTARIYAWFKGDRTMASETAERHGNRPGIRDRKALR